MASGKPEAVQTSSREVLVRSPANFIGNELDHVPMPIDIRHPRSQPFPELLVPVRGTALPGPTNASVWGGGDSRRLATSRPCTSDARASVVQAAHTASTYPRSSG